VFRSILGAVIVRNDAIDDLWRPQSFFSSRGCERDTRTWPGRETSPWYTILDTATTRHVDVREVADALFITKVVDVNGGCAIKWHITTNAALVMKVMNPYRRLHTRTRYKEEY